MIFIKFLDILLSLPIAIKKNGLISDGRYYDQLVIEVNTIWFYILLEPILQIMSYLEKNGLQN